MADAPGEQSFEYHPGRHATIIQIELSRPGEVV